MITVVLKYVSMNHVCLIEDKGRWLVTVSAEKWTGNMLD